MKDGINDNTGAVKKISINFSRVNTKFYLNLHYNNDESYLYGNKTDICKFKAHENMSWYNFCLGSVSKILYERWIEWNFFKWYYMWFSVDHSPVEKKDIFNIQEYLMDKNNIN